MEKYNTNFSSCRSLADCHIYYTSGRLQSSIKYPFISQITFYLTVAIFILRHLYHLVAHCDFPTIALSLSYLRQPHRAPTYMAQAFRLHATLSLCRYKCRLIGDPPGESPPCVGQTSNILCFFLFT